MRNPSLSIVVLAGGRSRRLGRDKALLPFAGTILVQHVVDRLATLSTDVLVVTRVDQHLAVRGARGVEDIRPEGGVLAGIVAGLEAAHNEWCLVVGCDMPFVNPDLVGYMISQTPGYDVVVPHPEVGYEPLHALYHRRCAPAVRRALEAGEMRVVSFYASLRIRCIGPVELAHHDPQGRSFFNINSPEDLAQAAEWLCAT